MRILSVVAVFVTVSMAGFAYAQFPQADPRAQADRQRMQRQMQQREQEIRERERQAQTACPLPDESSHPVNAELTYEGQRYRCVEVFLPTQPGRVAPGQDQTLTVRTAGWIKIPTP